MEPSTISAIVCLGPLMILLWAGTLRMAYNIIVHNSVTGKGK